MVLISLLILASATVREAVDPITDATSIFLTIRESDKYITIGCGDTSDRKTFRAKIELAAYVGDATAGLLAGGRPLEYRFNERAPSATLWHSHGTYVFATPPEARPVLFATELRHSTRLTVRTYDFAGEPRTVTFSYDDPTSQLDVVLARCGFNPDGTKLRRAPVTP